MKRRGEEREREPAVGEALPEGHVRDHLRGVHLVEHLLRLREEVLEEVDTVAAQRSRLAERERSQISAREPKPRSKLVSARSRLYTPEFSLESIMFRRNLHRFCWNCGELSSPDNCRRSRYVELCSRHLQKNVETSEKF